MDLTLNRMRIALKSIGEPCKSIPAIQIAGTNGKGSIASFISSCLKELGIKSGITTSPHLISWCERIRTNNELISLAELKKNLISLRPVINKYELTPFESLITCALNHFNRKEVELLVLEVGLGGRLDATTAHPYRPIIAMGGIGLDHCEQLGNNLKAITKEKAAIIQPGSVVITAKQHQEVEIILKEICLTQKARLHFVKPLGKEWNLGIPGDIQAQNAAVAKRALESLSEFGWEINERDIKKGLSNAIWPGRLQKAQWKSTPIIIDCAHNAHAAKQLSLERKNWEGEELGINWVLAMQTQKDAPSILNSLLQPNDLAWIVPVPNHSSWEKEVLLKNNPRYSHQIRSSLHVEEALYKISLKHKKQSPNIVITGSIYLLGDLLKRKVVNLKNN